MVLLVDERLSSLIASLDLKDVACALAKTLRHHVKAHDAMTSALEANAGREELKGRAGLRVRPRGPGRRRTRLCGTMGAGGGVDRQGRLEEDCEVCCIPAWGTRSAYGCVC